VTFSGTDGAGDEAAADLVRSLPGQLRSTYVHLPYAGLQPVVRLADARGRERVGRGDVRAGGEIAPMDVEDDVRAGQVEQVRITGQVLRVVREPFRAVVVRRQARVLEHRAPGAVQDDDPVPQEVGKVRPDLVCSSLCHGATSGYSRRPCCR
jgi:hypothetical protein